MAHVLKGSHTLLSFANGMKPVCKLVSGGIFTVFVHCCQKLYSPMLVFCIFCFYFVKHFIQLTFAFSRS